MSMPRRRVIDYLFICITAITDIIRSDPNLNGSHNNAQKKNHDNPVVLSVDADVGRRHVKVLRVETGEKTGDLAAQQGTN